MNQKQMRGNIYLNRLEEDIMNLIRQNKFEDGGKLVALIGERENIRSDLYELSKEK